MADKNDIKNWAESTVSKSKGGGPGHKGSAAPRGDDAKAKADGDGDHSADEHEESTGGKGWMKEYESKAELHEFLMALDHEIEEGDINKIKSLWGAGPDEAEGEDEDGGDGDGDGDTDDDDE